MYKHFLFDLDNTLANSRLPMKPEMIEMVKKLKGDITVISGADKTQIKKQVGKLAKYILGQYGACSPFWNIKLTKKEKAEVYDHLAKVKKFFPQYFKDESDLVQDRGSLIAFSFVGHNADLEKKGAFDRSGLFRQSILKTIPFESENMLCKIAGTTCFDYSNKNLSKGKNIERLIAHKGWNKDECIYFGDSLKSGGNDETVIGVIETVEVVNPADLLSKLEKYV